MLQNTRKTMGFKKIIVYEIPMGEGGKPYLASDLFVAIVNEHIMILKQILNA